MHKPICTQFDRCRCQTLFGPVSLRKSTRAIGLVLYQYLLDSSGRWRSWQNARLRRPAALAALAIAGDALDLAAYSKNQTEALVTYHVTMVGASGFEDLGGGSQQSSHCLWYLSRCCCHEEIHGFIALQVKLPTKPARKKHAHAATHGD